ncbi:MAG: Ig-like domain-containing protein [Pirellulales bacterium]
MLSFTAWLRSREERAREAAPAYPTLYLRRLEDRRVLNGEPVANADTFDVAEDGSLSVPAAGVLVNDTTSGGALSAAKVTDPAHGVLTLNADGSFDYTTNADFFGVDSFTYLVNDGTLDSLAPATVTITVTEVNDAPDAVDDTVSGNEDTQLVLAPGGLLGNDNAGPGEGSQNLSITAVSGTSAQGGTVAIVSGNVVYTPPPGFSGTDTFTYTITDDGTTNGQPDPLGDTATVTVQVAEVNDPPVAGPDNVTTAEDTPLSFPVSDLLANDTPGPADEAGQNLSIVGVSGTSAQGGTVTLVAGQITYTPPPDFVGTDTFTYTLQDDGTTAGAADPQQTTGTVTVTVTEVNDLPVATDDTASTAEDTPVDIAAGDLLANDTPGPSNEAGQALSVTGVSATSAAGGTVVLNSGVITYTPPADFHGTDTFTYTVTDDGTTNGSSDPRQTTATVTVTVTEVNDPPVLTDDNLVATEDQDLVFDASDLTANDTPGPADEAGQTLTVTAVSGTTAAGGTVTLSNGQITYTPPANYNGPDSFTYTVTDNGTTNGSADPRSTSATVFLTVQPVNDVPIVGNDQYTIDEDQVLNAGGATGVLANDSDVDSDPANNQAPGGLNDIDPASILIDTPPSHGQVVFASDGSFTYTPTNGFSGTDTFTYTVADSAGGRSAPATVTITINPVADRPTLTTAGLPTSAVPEGSTFQFTLTGQLNDPDGSETLTFELADVPQGWVVSSPDANVAFSPLTQTYTLTPTQPGATTVTVVIFAPDDGDSNIVLRAVSTESADPNLRASDEESTANFTAFNVAPTITVSDGAVDANGAVTVTVTVFDPGTDQLSFSIDWQDGTTYDSGVFVGGQTQTFVVSHQYFVTPPSVGSSGQIVIDAVAADDDNGDGVDTAILTVPGTGISVIRIDTTPQAPPPLAPPRAIPEPPPADRAIPVVNTRPTDSGGTRSEATQTSEPSLSLRVVSPDGEEGQDIETPLDTLRDLPAFFRRLPDGHYRLYLTERGGGQRRLVLDVFVRRGQPVDPEDQGTEGAATPDGALLPSPEVDRAARLERYWEQRASGPLYWPKAFDRAAEVDARMTRLALQAR